MTIQDIMNECRSWEHSKEHFEFMKECAELRLMEQYIADQEFIIENAADVTFKTLNESGIFMEATSDEKIREYREAFKEKATGLLSKIKAGFKKVCGAIAAFFKNLFAKITRADAKLVEFIKSHTFTNDEVDVIKNVSRTASVTGLGFVANSNVNANVDAYTNALLVLATGSQIHIDVSTSNVPNAVNIDGFVSVWKANYDDEVGDSLYKDLVSLKGKNKDILMNIFAEKNKNTQILEGLNKLQTFVSEELSKEGAESPAESIAKAYGLVNEIVPDTIKFYNGIYSLNEALRAKIKEMMKK